MEDTTVPARRRTRDRLVPPRRLDFVGHSDFAAHAKANGPGAHDEGEHKGWSSCQETSANYDG